MSGPRKVGDPSADALVAHLGPAAFRLGAALSRAPRNDAPIPPEVPADVARWLDRQGKLPAWADPARLDRAAAFGERHLGLIVLTLFAASLPRLFTGAKGAMVLGASGRMADEMDTRINETGRFVLDVWAPSGFRPAGAAIRSTLRVRLLHAAVRAHLRDKPGFTDEVPINQQDLLGTLLGFSIVVLDALRRLGVAVDREDAADVWHLFRVVGALSGITPRLLPPDPEAARADLARIEAQAAAPSPDGRFLAARLLARMEAHAVLPGTGHLPRALMSALLGPRRMALLGLAAASPPSPEDLLRIVALGARVGPRLLETSMAAKLAGRPVAFAVPARW